MVSVGLYSELSASGIDIKSFLQEDNVKVDFALDRASSNRSLLSLTRRKSDSDLSVRRFANKASGLYSGPRSHDSISMSLTSVTAPRHRRSFHSLMKSSVPVENTVDINAELTSVSLGSVNANISTDTQPLAAVKKVIMEYFCQFELRSLKAVERLIVVCHDRVWIVRHLGTVERYRDEAAYRGVCTGATSVLVPVFLASSFCSLSMWQPLLCPYCLTGGSLNGKW